VVLGLALVAQSFGTVFLVVKWLGVLYLGWLAWSFWTTGITAETVEARRRPRAASCTSGARRPGCSTLGNPKTMIFYLAITPTIVDVKSP
jgi:threonine/homoserine/homoserine lactone efflux protein